MPPVVTTKVMATATTSSGADWRNRLSRLTRLVNASVATLKPITITRKNRAMLSTGACAFRKSAVPEPCGRRWRSSRASVLTPTPAAIWPSRRRSGPTRSSRSVSPIRRSATLLPSYMTAMRSQTRNRSCSRWVISTIATPRSASRWISRSTASTSATARAEVGSSMISTRGSKAAARPMAMDWRWPPESWATSARRLGMWISSASRWSLASSIIRRWSSSRRPSTRASGLAAEEQVAGDVDRVAQREVLVDHLDLQGPGLGRRGERDARAVELDAAGVGHVGAGDDLGERGLAGGIVADQAQDLAREQVEIDAAQALRSSRSAS